MSTQLLSTSKGFTAVPADKVANALVKSVEGAQTGQTYRVY